MPGYLIASLLSCALLATTPFARNQELHPAPIIALGHLYQPYRPLSRFRVSIYSTACSARCSAKVQGELKRLSLTHAAILLFRHGLQKPVEFATVVTDLTTCHNTWFPSECRPLLCADGLCAQASHEDGASAASNYRPWPPNQAGIQCNHSPLRPRYERSSACTTRNRLFFLLVRLNSRVACLWFLELDRK